MTTDPWQIGLDHELTADPDERRRRGAWYTPRAVVEGLVGAAIDPGKPPRFVLDPTCGGGGFLVGVLDRLVAVGVPADRALAGVGGIDIDPGAVDAARRALDCWARLQGASGRARLHHGDVLDGLPAGWPTPDLVIGNPPFGTPLRGNTHSPEAIRFRGSRPELLGPYADLAAIHLTAAVETCAAGGRVCLVLPQSLLAGRDTVGLRRRLANSAPPSFIWAADRAVFDAGVRVWAPLLELGAPVGPVSLATGPVPTLTGRRTMGEWSELVADALGAPDVDLESIVSLGDAPSVNELRSTAGFRDEYYGLAAACREGDDHTGDGLRLVTVGALDPLTCWWGRRPIKFAKRSWERPTIDPTLLSGRVARWVERQLRPKIVLPTQSKVFEPVVDRDGRLVPATPVLSIQVDASDLDRVAAVLLAPPVVAWAHRRWFGTALSADAIKLAARDVSSLPVPPDRAHWQQAAALVATVDGSSPSEARSTVIAVGELMNAAFGADRSVFEWWLDRLP